MNSFERWWWRMWLGWFGPGEIKVSRDKWERGGERWFPLGKSIDWPVQPNRFSDFEKLVAKDKKRKITLYVAYGSPGLGKPLYVANGSGAPYKDNNTLKRNDKYWEEVEDRVICANRAGISVVVANTFVDQGVLGKYTHGLLEEDYLRTVKLLKRYSVMFCPLSEYDEGGSAGVNTGVALANATRGRTKAPVYLHPVRSSVSHRQYCDLICHQRFDSNRIRGELGHGMALMVAEDKGANDQQVMDRFTFCKNLNVPYIITNRNEDMSPTLENFCKAQ